MRVARYSPRLINLWSSDSRLNLNLEMLVFEERGKPEYRRKTSRSKDKNQQQTQPTYDAESRNRTRATLVGVLRGRQMLDHCATHAPQNEHVS